MSTVIRQEGPTTAVESKWGGWREQQTSEQATRVTLPTIKHPGTHSLPMRPISGTLKTYHTITMERESSLIEAIRKFTPLNSTEVMGRVPLEYQTEGRNYLRPWMVNEVNKGRELVLRLHDPLLQPLNVEEVDIVQLYERYCQHRAPPSEVEVKRSPCVGLAVAQDHSTLLPSFVSLFVWPWGQWIARLQYQPRTLPPATTSLLRREVSLRSNCDDSQALRNVLSIVAKCKVPMVTGDKRALDLLSEFLVPNERMEPKLRLLPIDSMSLLPESETIRFVYIEPLALPGPQQIGDSIVGKARVRTPGIARASTPTPSTDIVDGKDEPYLTMGSSHALHCSVDTISWRVFGDIRRLSEPIPKNPIQYSYHTGWKLRWEQMAALGCESLSYMTSWTST